MYGHTARKALIRIFREAPDLRKCFVEDTKGRMRKLRATDHRKLADRLLIELWMMGFAVSARQGSDTAPTRGGRSRAVHDEWRKAKTVAAAQTDVEDRQPPAPEQDRATDTVSAPAS